MALGKRRRERQMEAFVVASDLPKSPGHPFYTALNRLLAENGFDPLVEELGSSGISVARRGRFMEGRRLGRVPKWTHLNRITPVCLASMTPGGWSLLTSRSRIGASRSAFPMSGLA